MLSAVIVARLLSYPAMLLAEQLAHQRSVHSGPLVLGQLLSNPYAQRIETDLSHDGLNPAHVPL